MQKSFYRVWSLPGSVSETDWLTGYWWCTIDVMPLKIPTILKMNKYVSGFLVPLPGKLYLLSSQCLTTQKINGSAWGAYCIGCIPVPGCEMRINIGQSPRSRHLANHTVIHPQNSWSQASPPRNGPKPANSASFRRKTIPRKYLGRKNV